MISVLIYFFNFNLLALEPFNEFKIDKDYFPLKIENEQIEIDGELDDLAWLNVKSISDFVQQHPFNLSEPSRETSVKIAYDSNNLYVAVTLFDDPHKIQSRNSQYDDWYMGFDNNADYFVVEIDSRHDHQTSFGFAVNSSGVKADYMIYDDDPDKIDDDWNNKWDAKTLIFDKGWTIEYSIPLKILQFSTNVDMGINFIRYIKRLNEYNAWVVLPRTINGVVSHYGHLKNMDIESIKYLSVKPYLLSGVTNYDDQYFIDNNFNSPILLNKNNQNEKIGLQLKYIINSYTDLDIVFNPDFGQIEQDPSEINLTGYETYFDEKRDFFINNSSLFATPIDVFYSRRIGGTVLLSNDRYLSELNTAVKVTGKTRFGTSFGAIVSESSYLIDSLNINNSIYSNIFRMSKDILEGNSYVGFLGTTYNNQIEKSEVIAIDALININNNKLIADGQIAMSNNNSTGLGGSFELGYREKPKRFKHFFNNKIIESWFNLEIFDKDFDISKVGYLPRNNLKNYQLGIALLQEQNGEIFNDYILNMSMNYAENFDNVQLLQSFDLGWKSTFSNFWNINFNINLLGNYYNDRLYDYYLNATEHSRVVKMSASESYYMGFGSPKINDFSFSFLYGYFNNELKDKSNEYIISTSYKPNPWLNIDLSYNYNTSNEKYHFLMTREKPHFGETPRIFNSEYFTVDEDSREYLFTSSLNKQKSLTFNSSTYIKNNISLELYVEYFSNRSIFGNYTSKLESDFSYPEGEFNYTLPMNEINLKYRAKYTSATVNYVFKWEYKQNSNIYLVYSYYKEINGKNLSGILDVLDYANSDNELTEIFSDKSFFLKWDYWFDV